MRLLGIPRAILPQPGHHLGQPRQLPGANHFFGAAACEMDPVPAIASVFGDQTP